MKGDVRVGEQVVHFHIGQYVGVGAFELEDFQVQARGVFRMRSIRAEKSAFTLSMP